MAVSRRLRYEVLRRDNHTCRYCGAGAPDVQLTVDHVAPVALGGTDNPGNLVTACRSCNAGKAASNPDQPLVHDVAADALRWAQAMRHAAALQEAKRGPRNVYLTTFDRHWSNWQSGPDDRPQPIPRPDLWRESIERFHDAGLETELLLEALTRAMENTRVIPDEKFRYFCGIGWSILRERTDIAAELLATEEAR